eukprot:s3823_g2.t1
MLRSGGAQTFAKLDPAFIQSRSELVASSATMTAMWFIGLLQLSQVFAAPRCETFAPSGQELRDDGRLAGWSVEQLRGRRWSAAVVSSGGGEELFDGCPTGPLVHTGNPWFAGTATIVVMPFAMKSILAAVLGGTGLAITTRSDATVGGNPIRKVVSMMEKMADKIEGEAEKESDQYDKFSCYCKKTIASLEESIQKAETNPISQADIDKKQSEISALQQEVKTLKEDRIAEENTLKSAEMQRGKEHDEFVHEVTEEKEVVEGVDAATAALKGGETASFLQQTNQAHGMGLVQGIQNDDQLMGIPKVFPTSFS